MKKDYLGFCAIEKLSLVGAGSGQTNKKVMIWNPPDRRWRDRSRHTWLHDVMEGGTRKGLQDPEWEDKEKVTLGTERPNDRCKSVL